MTTERFSRHDAEMKHCARNEKRESRDNEKRRDEAEPAWASGQRQPGKKAGGTNGNESSDEPGERWKDRSLEPGSTVQCFDRVLLRCLLRREPRGDSHRSHPDSPRKREHPWP